MLHGDLDKNQSSNRQIFPVNFLIFLMILQVEREAKTTHFPPVKQ